MKQIPFTDKEYSVTEDGNVWSAYSNRFLQGKKISNEDQRLVVHVKIDGKMRSLMISRVVFFLYKYNPIVLKKKSPSFRDYSQMPKVVYKNDSLDNSLKNLILSLPKEELAKWTNKRIPVKGYKPKHTIAGEEAEFVLKQLRLGKSNPSIAKQIGRSNMVVFRFAKAHNIKSPRESGRPKLRTKDILFIFRNRENYSQKQLAIKFKVSESAISRLFKGKTYKSITDFLPPLN